MGEDAAFQSLYCDPIALFQISRQHDARDVFQPVADVIAESADLGRQLLERLLGARLGLS
jgi:hypothetical protein